MSKFKEILTAFGTAAKDAQPEEVDALATLTSLALDAQESVPAEEAQEDVPAEEAEEEVEDEMVEKAPKGDDLGTKLDSLLERIATIEKKLSAGETKDEEASEVIEEEEEEEIEGKAKDFMSVLRPALKGISNKRERAMVSSAILDALSTDSMNEILKASGEAARQAADSAGKTDYEKACMASETAYASRNPHMRKENK